MPEKAPQRLSVRNTRSTASTNNPAASAPSTASQPAGSSTENGEVAVQTTAVVAMTANGNDSGVETQGVATSSGGNQLLAVKTEAEGVDGDVDGGGDTVPKKKQAGSKLTCGTSPQDSTVATVIGDTIGKPHDHESIGTAAATVSDHQEAIAHKRGADDRDPHPNRNKRVRKTREEKMEILRFVESGGTHVAAAERFGVSRTAVTKMVKEREAIIADAEYMTVEEPTPENGPHVSVVHEMAATGVRKADASRDNEDTTESPSSTSGGEDKASPTVQKATKRVQVANRRSGATKRPTSKDKTADSLAKSKPTASHTIPSMDASVVNPAPPSTPTIPVTAPVPTALSKAGGQAKPKRVRKTNEEKMQILEFVEAGGSQVAAAQRFGVSRTAVTKMVKEKEAITALVRSGSSHHRKVLQYQHKLSIIEEMLYKWQLQVEIDAPTIRMTGDLLQVKAIEFRDKIINESKEQLQPDVMQSLIAFKASNGWLQRYLMRRNVRTGARSENAQRPEATTSSSTADTISRIAADASSSEPRPPSDTTHAPSERLCEILRQRFASVSMDCIWNLGEVAVLPRRLGGLDADTKEGKSPAQHTTVTLLVSASGKRFKPSVLGEFKDFLGTTLGSAGLNVDATNWSAVSESVICPPHSSYGQDASTLALYLHAVGNEAKALNETWYILMDSSPSHVNFVHMADPAGSIEQGFRYESLVLFVTPLKHVCGPNRKNQPAPLGYGITRVFKAAYRQSLLKDIVARYNKAKSAALVNGDQASSDKDDLLTGTNNHVADASSRFNVETYMSSEQVLKWISSAWEMVPPELIRHCWVRHGLLSSKQLTELNHNSSRVVEAVLFESLSDVLTQAIALREGEVVRDLGLPLTTTATTATPDLINGIISLDDGMPTERREEQELMSQSAFHHSIEASENGDLRALV